MSARIPLTRPYVAGREIELMAQAQAKGHLAGDGEFTALCHRWLEGATGCHRALLTHSCTAALEMSAMLLSMEPGDEVIMPSFTFVSTANAFVRSGAVPVFVDVRADTLNIDENLIEEAVSPRTRAICVVHYAGVSCEMDAILLLAKQRGLTVVEDAAQGIMAEYRGRALGSMGQLGTVSFHETKNVVSGEGGALLINEPECVPRAEVLREKGTNRSRFFRGEVDKYTWVDVGSSFLPSELTAAFLAAQFRSAEVITARRLALWERYDSWAEPLAAEGLLRRPIIPPHCSHNAHMYYVLLPSPSSRTTFLKSLNAEGIGAAFHYVPLHSSPAGERYGRTVGSMAVTDSASERLVRLPLWPGLEDELDSVLDRIESCLRRSVPAP